MDKMAQNGYAFEGDVVRNASFSEEQISSMFAEGGTFQDKGFLSTTSNVEGVFPGNTRFDILSNTGIKVQDLSEYAEETEILFKPGTSFDVLSSEYNSGSGVWEIIMREAK